MSPEQLRDFIDAGETQDIEFKGEEREEFSDSALVEAVVCLANRSGNQTGYLFVGIEDDGRLTGARPRHGPATDPFRLQALISNRTRPSQSCRVEEVPLDGLTVLAVEVPVSRTPVGTSDGRYVRRALDGRGRPACVPFAFHEMQSHQSSRQMLDYSQASVTGATWDDLDPLEFARFRRSVRESRGRGDASLVELSDLEIAKALGAVELDDQGNASPRVLALLLFGREDSVRRFVPAHEVAFQVLEGTALPQNEFFRWPLLRVVEEIESRLATLNREDEIVVGLARIRVPMYPHRALRESIANALIHRDYTRLGAAHVQWHADRLEVSNPGGFPEGVHLGNLLTTPPRPRNLLLADAFKRAGLVDRTARGIDTIFEQQLRNGRPKPIYDRSTANDVVVVLPGGEANLGFIHRVVEEERAGRPLGLDGLLILNCLWYERSTTGTHAAELIQKSESEARTVLNSLVEHGLLEGRGSGKGRTFHLSAAVYRQAGQAIEYVRQRGFEPIQHEQMVIQFLRTQEKVRRADVMELCQLTQEQAKRLLQRLAAEGRIVQHGSRGGAYYRMKE